MTAIEVKFQVDGRALAKSVLVEAVVLEQSLEGHHVARVRLVSVDRKDLRKKATRAAKLDELFAKISKPATLTFSAKGGGGKTVFKGLIVSATHERATRGGHALLLAVASPTQLLDGGPRYEIWEEASVKDIVSSISGRASGLDSDLKDLPTDALPYEAQFGESDFEFVRRLAGRCSLWLYYDGQKLLAKSLLSPPGEPKKLGLQGGKSVGILQELSITSRLVPSVLRQAQYLEGPGEDDASSDGEAASTKVSHDYVKTVWDCSAEKFGTALQPGLLGEPREDGDLGGECKVLAQSALRHMVVASGATDHQGLFPGAPVKLEGTGSGAEETLYVVSTAIHDWQRHGGYSCRFSLVPASAAYPPVSPVDGSTRLQRGIVVGEYGKEHPGMVKVRYSRSVDGGGEEDQAVTTWIRVASPHAGVGGGLVALPEVNDEVVIGHLGGRATHPVVLGSLFSSQQDSKIFSEIESEIEENDGKAFLTKSGNIIVLKDTGGKETVEIRSPNQQNTLRLTMDGGPQVVLETKGDVTVSAAKTVSIHATEDMTLSAGGNMSLSAKGDMALDATGGLRANAVKNVEIAGAELKAQGQAKAELGAAQVDVKGQARVGIQGAMVKIN